MSRTEDRENELDEFEHERPVDCPSCGRVWAEEAELSVAHNLPVCPQCGETADWPPGYPRSEADEEWEAVE